MLLGLFVQVVPFSLFDAAIGQDTLDMQRDAGKGHWPQNGSARYTLSHFRSEVVPRRG